MAINIWLCCRLLATLGHSAWGYSCALNAVAAAIGIWLLAAHQIFIMRWGNFTQPTPDLLAM